VHGDVNAINVILKHFEHYIIRLSQKTLFDEYGNPYIHVEEETKRMLGTKLITAILRFNLS
ncbi:TPA: helix-turn-helix domain-containing protein, partial [Clostridioides difficile]|nr:helix-turn-helix domain-containing protein [Clostridioides difficile]